LVPSGGSAALTDPLAKTTMSAIAASGVRQRKRRRHRKDAFIVSIARHHSAKPRTRQRTGYRLGQAQRAPVNRPNRSCIYGHLAACGRELNTTGAKTRGAREASFSGRFSGVTARLLATASDFRDIYARI
jgi:hypothetical protein